MTECVKGSPEGRERRRAVRRPVDGHMAIVPVVLPVQVLDISSSGVLLTADCALHPGRGGMLCLDMNGEPFRGEIQVQRMASAARPDSYEMGASFLSLSPEYRHILRRITQ
jgi:PilZ domain